MIKQAAAYCGKTILSFLEIIAGLLFVIAIVLGVVLWKFSKGPVDVTWVAPYLESAITDGNSDIKLRTGSIIADWPDFSGPLSLGVSEFRLISGQRRIVYINSVGIRLSKAALLIGQISPEAIIVTQPTIKMIRNEKGEFKFSFAGQNQDNEQSSIDPISGKDIENALFLNDHFLPNTLLGVWNNLESFTFKDAQFVSEDHISGVTWTQDKVDISLTRSERILNGQISFPPLNNTVSKDESQMSVFASRRKGDTTNFQVKFSSFDTSIFGRLISEMSIFSGDNIVLNGDVQGVLDKDFMVQSINGAVSSSQFADAAFEVDGKRDGNKLPITFKLKEITLAQIAAIWPQQYKDTNAAEWLTKRLSKGILSNVAFVAPFEKGKDGKWSLVAPRASFDYKNLDVNYREPLSPVVGGFGNAVIEDDALKIKVDGGSIGTMALSSSQVNISNLTRPEPTMITIEANATSPISGILNYIYTDPILLKENIGIDPKTVKGIGKANVKLTVPGNDDMKVEDIDVAVTGTVNDVLFPKLVNGLDISGGPYDIIVDDGEFRFKGTGQIDGRKATLDYKEFLDRKSAPYNFNLVATIDTDAALRQKLGVNISNFVDGPVATDIEYKEEKDNTAQIDVSANLTNARVMISPISYEKAAGRSGFATAKVYLKNDQVQKIDGLNITMGQDKANGLLLFGKVGNAQDVVSGTFSSVQLGDANNFDMNFKQTAPNVYQFDVKGASVDARSFLGKKKTSSSSASTSSSISANVTVSTPKLRGGDKADQIVRNAQISASVNPNGDVSRLSVTGTVGTKDPISIQISPSSGLSISTPNAGAFLYAFDIYDNMRGGQLNVQARPIAGQGINDFRGTADIRNFRLVKAPILAKLINAFSLSGITELLGSEGLEFSRLRSEFDWRNSKSGRVINVRNGKATGASIGLTFGGVINQDSDTMDLSGTIVPIAGVNKFVSKIPLVGELLTGGKDGGVIAATYAVKGSSGDPNVFVNPLSVLAPGFLRSILFEGGETLPGNGNSAPKKRELN